jgi:hypothetical protein
MIFEGRIPRKISGPIQERDGRRIWTNHELNKLAGGANTVRFRKVQRLKCEASYIGWRGKEWKGGFLNGIQWERYQEDAQGIDGGKKS